MQDGDGSSTSTVVEPSSTESLSTQTDEPITSRHQTSVDDSASNLSELEISTLLQIQSSSNSDLQGTSKAGNQTSIDRTLLPWLVTKVLCYKMTLFVV